MLFGILVGYVLGLNIQSLAFVFIGSLLPDADISSSICGKFNVLAWFKVVQHRGIFHTIPGALIFAAPVVILYGINCGTGLFLGFISHLILDSYTPMGIMWRYPLDKEYYNLPKLKSILFLIFFYILAKIRVGV